MAGVLLLGLFLLWQFYLERVEDAVVRAEQDAKALSEVSTASEKRESHAQLPAQDKNSKNMGLFERLVHPTSTKRSKWTPPPIMKLSLWARADGKYAAMMIIAFVNWCSFLAWVFWAQVC